MILKKGWFSDLVIQEIYGQVICEEYAQVSRKRTETQNIENKNIMEPISTTSEEETMLI